MFFSKFWIGVIASDYDSKVNKDKIEIIWYVEGASGGEPNGCYSKSYKECASSSNSKRVTKTLDKENIKINRIIYTFAHLATRGKISKQDYELILKKIDERKKTKSSRRVRNSTVQDSELNNAQPLTSEELESGIVLHDDDSDVESGDVENDSDSMELE